MTVLICPILLSFSQADLNLIHMQQRAAIVFIAMPCKGNLSVNEDKRKTESEPEITGDLCPECGCFLIFQNGCYSCLNCPDVGGCE